MVISATLKALEERFDRLAKLTGCSDLKYNVKIFAINVVKR